MEVVIKEAMWKIGVSVTVVFEYYQTLYLVTYEEWQNQGGE